MSYFTQPDLVSREEYLYALKNFRIAHEKVEQQRVQLEEQESQVASLRQRIALLEGNGQQAGVNEGLSSVDDVSIKNAASRLDKLINRWAAEVIRVPPVPLGQIRDAAVADIGGSFDDFAIATPLFVQNLLRHAISEMVAEGIVNCFIITNSSEANVHLTRIHENLFARDPTVACVWRRQTFSAAVESCTPELSQHIIEENIPTLARLLLRDDGRTLNSWTGILSSAYAFSRMLHGSQSNSGATSDILYRAFMPEVCSILYAGQIELVKRCLRTERGEQDRVGATVFLGLVKIRRGSVGPDGQPGEAIHTVVRRAQVICECALHGTGAFNLEDAGVL